jgi:hypothetical protein
MIKRKNKELDIPDYHFDPSLRSYTTASIILDTLVCPAKGHYQQARKNKSHILATTSAVLHATDENEKFADVVLKTTGRHFEQKIIKPEFRKHWLKKIHLEGLITEAELTDLLNITDDSPQFKKGRQSKNTEEDIAKSLWQLNSVFAEEKQAAILVEMSFATENLNEIKDAEDTLEGRSDIILWTGKKFIIGDIKLAPSLKTSHTTQVYLYYILLQATLKEINPNCEISDIGFILQGDPACHFSLVSSQEIQKHALKNAQISTFSLKDQKRNYDYSRELLSKDKIDYCINSRIIGPQCRACSFRHGCYDELIAEEKTPLSCSHLKEQDLEEVKQTNIKNIETLVIALETNPKLLPNQAENPFVLEATKTKLKKAQKYKGVALWQPKIGWEEHHCFGFLAYPDASNDTTGEVPSYPVVHWVSSHTPAPTSSTHILTKISLPFIKKHQVIFTWSYTEVAEIKKYLKEILNISDLQISQCTIIPLEAELEKKITIPFPSSNLEGLSFFLKAFRDFGFNTLLTLKFFKEETESKKDIDKLDEIQLLKNNYNIDTRLAQLQEITKTLFELNNAFQQKTTN